MELYIGKPYDFKSFNCWHYVSLVREDNNVKTKMFQPKTLSNAYEIITAQMSIIDNGLNKVDEPQDLDIVIVEKPYGSRRIYHCGIYHGGDVSHCDSKFGSVRNQSYKEFIKDYDGVTFWR